MNMSVKERLEAVPPPLQDDKKCSTYRPQNKEIFSSMFNVRNGQMYAEVLLRLLTEFVLTYQDLSV